MRLPCVLAIFIIVHPNSWARRCSTERRPPRLTAELQRARTHDTLNTLSQLIWRHSELSSLIEETNGCADLPLFCHPNREGPSSPWSPFQMPCRLLFVLSPLTADWRVFHSHCIHKKNTPKLTTSHVVFFLFSIHLNKEPPSTENKAEKKGEWKEKKNLAWIIT